MGTLGALAVPPRPLFVSRSLQRLSCALFGHAVDNRRFETDAPAKTCPCGRAILGEDGSHTRTRHTLSCFLGHHRYVPAGTRHGHNEYMCSRCGHPLLFEAASDPYAQRPQATGRERSAIHSRGARPPDNEEAAFEKKVRYLCGLFGHRVHLVTARRGMTEYACFCGHSFLRAEGSLLRVTHPLVCVLLGHFVSFVERRGDYAEHVCRNCGHTFGFVTPT